MAKSYDHFYLYQEQPKQELPKSILTSVFIHGLLAIAILTVVVPEIKAPAEEIVIEVLEQGSSVQNAAQSVQNAAPLVAPVLADKNDIPTLKLPKSKNSKVSKVVKIKSTSVVQSTIATKTLVGATLDDIETPTLDDSDIVMNKQNHKLADKDLDSTFESVDHENSKMINEKIGEAEHSLTAAENNLNSDLNSEIDDLKADNQHFAQQVDQSLGQMKSNNANRLAALKQGELKAAAEAAALKNARGSGQGGFGVASTGLGQGQSPSGIRSLQELKQQPGNPMPSYSLEERFRKEQGKVVFQAFVTAQGQLTQFRLLQSTGYQNLDAKTLAVLKKWKFYPGQQGWVEIPQVWSLKGEEQELPAALRRKQLSKN